jgi:hypothetical protein
VEAPIPRNPIWTPSNAADALTAISANPPVSASFSPSSGPYEEARLQVSGNLSNQGEYDFVRVFFRADSDYVLSGLSFDYQVVLSIFDTSGYLVATVPAREYGYDVPALGDAIVGFIPDTSGYYYVSISTSSTTPASGEWALTIAEDVGGDNKNGGATGPAINYYPLVLNTVHNILRRGPADVIEQARIIDGAFGLQAAAYTQQYVIDQIAQEADASTSVATLAYQFFTGKIPSGAGLDYLVSPTGPNPNNLNSAYYQDFNLENRYINFAVNLGKNGEGRAQFEAAYGAKSLLDTMKSAYLTVFGSTPTDAKAHVLLDSRVDYFAYYGQDGQNGIGTKAALVGWLLAEAAKADVGTMQTANLAFLSDLADGANYSVDLVGTYGGTPYFG